MTSARPMQVLLVHGMGRTPLSMVRLGLRLGAAGMRVHYFGYFAPAESVERMTVRLARRLHAMPGPYIVVGHSLGGVLLRLAIDRLPDGTRRPERLVLVGSPHGAPRLARRLSRWPVYRLVSGEAGQMLADPSRMAALPRPAVPCTVVVGTRGFPARLSPFGEEPNDGLVAVVEAIPGEAAKTLTLARGHTFLMNAREVREHICDLARTAA